MVGAALLRHYSGDPRFEMITASRQELDLRDGTAVTRFLEKTQPQEAIVAAARVGGIEANRRFPAEFLYDNLLIAAHLVEGFHRTGVERALFLGSSCIYPRLAPQPIPETALLSGALEPTNEAYAIAKIAGLKLFASYRQQYGKLYHSAMPTNLYGVGDQYHGENAHVVPALIQRFETARLGQMATTTVWGSGTPKRELLYVDDLARALAHLIEIQDPPDWVNIGSGEEHTIADLAAAVARAVGFEGRLLYDAERPDGTPRKVVDSSWIREQGWAPKVPLNEGLRRAVTDYRRRRRDGEFDSRSKAP